MLLFELVVVDRNSKDSPISYAVFTPHVQVSYLTAFSNMS